MSSEGANHNEFDFEFLGNTTGEPYLVQTNIYVNGVGNREQRLNLWFDPTADFHSYSILWNQRQVVYVTSPTHSPLKLNFAFPYISKKETSLLQTHLFLAWKGRLFIICSSSLTEKYGFRDSWQAKTPICTEIQQVLWGISAFDGRWMLHLCPTCLVICYCLLTLSFLN